MLERFLINVDVGPTGAALRIALGFLLLPVVRGLGWEPGPWMATRIKGDFRCFLATATGYGTVGVRKGKPFVEVTSGQIECREIKYAAKA